MREYNLEKELIDIRNDELKEDDKAIIDALNERKENESRRSY